MLTIQRCREILGRDCVLADERLEEIRDAYYLIADVAIDSFLTKGNEGHQEDALERAAICEYDGGVPRGEAVRLGWHEALRKRTNH